MKSIAIQAARFLAGDQLIGFDNPHFRTIREYCLHYRNENFSEFKLQIHQILIQLWQLNPVINEAVSLKVMKFLPKTDYAVFHIRRGDKVSQKEDLQYRIEQYASAFRKADLGIQTVIVMTDDFRTIAELQACLPTCKITSMSNPDSEGHYQQLFNAQSKHDLKEQTLQLLSEIELARNAKAFFGSFGSNLFRLIEYFRMSDCYDISGMDKTNRL